MIQSEQMYSLDGAFTLSGSVESGFELKNGTRLSLFEAGVLMRDQRGNFQAAWIGDLDSGNGVQLKFKPTSST